jgi:predicted DNA-binding protein (MmcQ/YjbR family)
MTRLDTVRRIALALPEAEEHVVESWEGEVTFRVRGKVFVFAGTDASTISVKLGREEAAALAEADPRAVPTGYGLGRHGWISYSLKDGRLPEELSEWVLESYCNVAPKRLAAAARGV